MTITRTQLSLALAALALAGCRGGNAQQSAESEPVLVRAVPVADTVIARPVPATGTVAPRDEATLSFKIGGVIERILVDAGDRVRAGRLLATLDLREIDAALSRARSAAEKAERDLARAERLYQDSVVTLAQFQDAETAAEVARADLEAARFNRRYAVILAPSDGVVLRRSAEPGETVGSGDAILVVGGRARGNVVRVGLADRDVVAIRLGDPASARFDAVPDRVYQGRVTQIAAAADRATGTYAVELALQDGGDLPAGLVGEVEIHPGRGAPTTLVPIEAVLEADGARATVYALSADRSRALRRRVTVAFITGNRVALANGLEGDTLVVTDGAAWLDDGAAVREAP